MSWEVEFTDEFGEWWDALSESEQEDVRASVMLLSDYGPALKMPHSSGIQGSKHAHMRELRIQHAGRPYRILYAFNPLRTAILLIGGDKTGNGRWYEKFFPSLTSYMTSILRSWRRRESWMARNFRELESKMSPASRERSDAKYEQLRKDMTLAELREALSLTQTTLAKTLDINQAAVSKIEKRTDIFLSTLRNYIRAMGGELEIRASFPGRQPVIINQFSEVESRKSLDFAKG